MCDDFCDDDPEPLDLDEREPDDDDDSPERCSECAMWGEYQCSRHSEAYLNLCREVDERHSVKQALETVVSLAGSRGGGAWSRLVRSARSVLEEIEREG